MKQINLAILLAILMNMVGVKAFAHDIEVANADGVTIYYNYINHNTELEVTASSYNNKYSGNVVIPESVSIMDRTLKVTNIDDYAFYVCNDLTSITIPSSVTSIGIWAFSQCSGLTSVFIPNSVTNIGNYAFNGCSGLTSLTISDNITSIGDYVFGYCRGLTSLIIPNSVTNIGDHAFTGCSGLTSLTIPDNVTSIDNYAFRNCSGLTSLTISNNMISIGNGAFLDCSSLTSLTIPSSVTNIGYDAFRYCSSLISISIPNSVTNIGIGAFEDCNNITTIVSLIEEPFKIYDETFSQIAYDNGTLYIPQGTMEKYKATDGWKKFSQIKEGRLSDIRLPHGENTDVAVLQLYTLNGQQAVEPQRGLNIVKMNDGTTRKIWIKKP